MAGSFPVWQDTGLDSVDECVPFFLHVAYHVYKYVSKEGVDGLELRVGEGE